MNSIIFLFITLISILFTVNSHTSFNDIFPYMPLSSLNLDKSSPSIISTLFDVLRKHSTPSIEPSLLECSESITKASDTTINKMVINSGKSKGDIGIEHDCRDPFSYYLITYQLGNSSSSDDQSEIIALLGAKRDFFIGLCLINQCDKFMQEFFNKTTNAGFFNYLNESYDIKNIRYLQSDEVNTKSNKIKNQTKVSYYAYIVISLLLLILFVLKVLATFFGNCFLKPEEIAYQKAKNLLYEEENRLSLLGDNDDIYYNYDDGIKGNNEKDESYESNRSSKLSSNSLVSKISIERKRFKVINFLSLGNDIVLLNTIKNDYYSEKSLKIISFYRMILLFMISFNHYFYTLYKFPGRDYFNVDFYASFWFSIIKFTMLVTDCFIALDAFVTGYKLMCYMKKNMYASSMSNFKSFASNTNTHTSLGKLLLKFSLLSIPKIVLFFANFYILHVFSPYYSNLLTEGPMHEYYIEYIAKEKVCEKSPYIIFFPFYMAYFDFSESTNMSFINCYRFVNVYLNEFYVFIIFLFLFWIMCRIRSKIFDWSIAVIVILGSLLSYVTFYYSGNSSSKTYDFGYILGQNLTLKHTHLFFNTYMLGIFGGFVYFYFCDSLSKHPLSQTSHYIPFAFCQTLTKGINSLSLVTKYLIVILCFTIQILLSMSYNILRAINQANHINPDTTLKILTFPITTWMKILDCYDKQVFTLSFVLSLVILVLTPRNSFIRHLSNASIFTLFSRINFSIFSSLDSIIYVMYCVFIFQMKMTYSNLIYNTIGAFGFIVIICTVITIIFELPLRMLVKGYIRKSEMQENIITGRIVFDSRSSVESSLI